MFLPFCSLPRVLARGPYFHENRCLGEFAPKFSVECRVRSSVRRHSARTQSYSQGPKAKGQGLFFSHLPFIRGRAIDRRHRNVVQAQIHSQLSSMVNDVVHDEAAHYANARQGKDRLALVYQ